MSCLPKRMMCAALTMYIAVATPCFAQVDPRVGANTGAPVAAPAANVALPAAGTKVEVFANEKWVGATIVKAEDGRAFVKFDGSSDSFDEWVGPSRIRPAGGGAALAPARTGFAGTWVFNSVGYGILRLLEDGSYISYGPGWKVVGKWEKNAGGIAIHGGDTGKDEWTATLTDGGETLAVQAITVRKATAAAGDRRIVQEAQTDPAFFLGNWNIYNTAGVVKNVPVGTMAIKEGGAVAFVNAGGGQETGSWKKSASGDGILVTVGTESYEIMQYHADNQGLYLRKPAGGAHVGVRAAK